MSLQSILLNVLEVTALPCKFHCAFAAEHNAFALRVSTALRD